MGDDERLEQRIKTLEYEFKILKSEIQRTLLDIQEQVLIHYYPTLRAEDPAAEADVQQSLRAVQEKKQTVAAKEPTALVELPSAPPPPLHLAPPEVPVAAKKVSLDEVRQARGEAPAVAPAGEANAGAPALIGGVEQATALALSAWVNVSSNRIGAERLSKLVETAAMRGIVSPDVRNVVMKLVSLGGVGTPPAVVPVNDSVKTILKLYEIVGRPSNVEEAITVIDEARVG